MSRLKARPDRWLAGRVRRLSGRIARWHRLSIRRRILVAMLAVSVIPLAIFSLAGMAALSGLNSGALKTANNELEASQGGHLQDLVDSKALVINDGLESVQDEVALLSQATGQRLAQPPSQSQASPGITIYGPGAHATQPSSNVLALQSLSSELALVYQLHPEVADVWVQLPSSGLVAVAPASAIPSAQKASQSELSPPMSAYQEGVSRLASALDNPHWRSLLLDSTQSVVWTPVYDNPAAGGPTVTVATETISANGIAFWVGANITVKNLVSNFLTRSPGHSEGGYGFLVSSDGALLSYSPGGKAALGGGPKRNRGAPLNLLAKKSPWLAVGTSMTRGESGQQTINLGGEAVAVFFSPLPASQWSLGVGIPVSGIDGSVVGFSQTITHGLVGVTALLLPFLLILAALVAILTDILSRRLLHPLSNLTGASRRIAGGDLDTPVAVTPGPPDEIGTLELALEGMRKRLSGQHQIIDAAQRNLEQRVEERTTELRQRNDELAILNSVSADLSRSLVLSDVASAAAEQLRQLWKVSEVSVYLLDGTAPQGIRLVGRSGDDEPADQVGSELRRALDQSDQSPAAPVQVDDLVVVPLQVTGSGVGYLVLHQAQVPGQRQIEMLEVVGGQLALALRNAQLFADTQEMATLNERNRIAREIHDTLAQGLTGILVQLQAADAWMSMDPHRAQAAVEQATELARSSLHEARRSVWDLRPEGLERAGLAGAIREELSRLQERTGIRTGLKQKGMKGRPLQARLEVAAFRIIQEALANAVRHGRPTEVIVDIGRVGAELRVTIADNGQGFDPGGPLRPGGFGITSMRERAAMCGGRLDLISVRGGGTQVVLQVPYPEPTLSQVAR
ncbi:MAG TPA: histidine kinase [Candidatus Dormibacteraeota bacterium]|nr:histidine kinase [Candidatus Dormibacteraeota bacterium]